MDLLSVIKDKAYLLGVYRKAIRPVLLKYVESTENNKWDDALLSALDFVVNRLLDGDDASMDD